MHETLPATSNNGSTNTQHNSNISSSGSGSGSGGSQPQANLYQSQDTHNSAQDYRYAASSSSSSSYVTTLAKANEAAGQVPLYAAYSTTATVDNAAAAGEAPYCLPRVLPANEFVSTLKSCGKQRSPQKQPASRHGSYCDCFARAGAAAGAGGAAGVPHKATAALWPALLANLGILALLLCYILMGSFIFLTIENSVAVVGDAENIDVGVAVGAADAAAWHFTQVPQTAAAAAKPQQVVAAINAAATTTNNNLLQAHRDNASRFDNNNNNSSNNQAAVANALAHSHTSAFSAARNFGVAAVPEAETYIDSVHDKHSSAAVSPAHGTNRQQPPLAQAVLSTKAQLDFELQSLSLAETEAAAEGEQFELDAQDVERQRAVENIWDITVSLNILYKENWTKLAALEIAKFQDQLVKRFIMDLTLPLANEAHSSAGAAAAAKAAPARGRNILQQDSATMQQSGQQQQQQQQQNMHDEQSYQQQRFWQLQHTRQRLLQRQQRQQQQQQRSRRPFEWNFATAFLYSLTVITTVGYGTITPRTTCGRMVTIAYATLGIPLTLVYLSSVGGILAKLLRTLCTRLLCCCLCRPHSSCAGFSRQQQVSDRKCDLKLKQLQQRQQHQQTHQQPQQHPHPHQHQQQLLPYCYVRPPADLSGAPADVTSAFDTLSVATTTAESRHSGGTHALSWSLVLPVALCLLLLLAYVGVGALVMALLEHWPLMDGVYFCFMSLTTIGFCDLLPGLGRGTSASASHCVIWFCALYILSGLTLTSMCVNLLHEEILLRMRVVLKFQKVPSAEARQGKRGFYSAPP